MGPIKFSTKREIVCQALVIKVPCRQSDSFGIDESNGPAVFATDCISTLIIRIIYKAV